MLKKLISFILCMTMLCSNTAVFAEASGGLYEDFSDSSMDLSVDYMMAGNVALVENEEVSNYLSIGENSYFQKLYKSPVSQAMYAVFNINVSNLQEGYLFLKSNTGTGKNIAEFKNGSMYVDGVSVMELKKDIWNTVSFEISADSISFYSEDELLCTTDGEENVQIIRFGSVSGEMLIDNISVVDGTKPEPEVYSDEEVSVYYSQGFNDAAVSASGVTFLQYPECLSYQNNKGVNGKALCFITQSTEATQEPFVQFDTKKLTGKVVLSYHLKMNSFITTAGLATMKSVDGTSLSFATVDTSGTLCYVTNGWGKYPSAKKLSPKKWHRIQVAMDFDTQTYNLYLDYQIAAENIPFGFNDVHNGACFRIQLTDSDGLGNSMYVDNMTVYSGENLHVAPRLEIDLNNVKTTIDADSSTSADGTVEIGGAYQASLAAVMTSYNAIGLMVGQKNAYKKKEKIILNAEPEVVEERTYIPLRDVAEAFDMEVSWDDSTRTAAVKDSNSSFVFKEGDINCTVNGTQKTLERAPYIKNGSIMMPLRFLAESMGKKVTYQEPQLITIGDSEGFLTRESDKYLFNELVQTLIYERPSREVIMSDIIANGGIKHPCIYAPANKYNEVIAKYKDGVEPYKKWGDAIISRANKNLTEAVVNAADYPDANSFLQAARKVSKVTEQCSMAYLLTGNEAYAERVWKEVEAAISMTSWEPGHFLNIGEMVDGVAIAYDMLYSYFNSGQKSAIKKGIVELGLNEGIRGYRDPGERVKHWGKAGSWVVLDTNWNLVCNGGLLVGALMVADDPLYKDVAAEVLEGGIRGMEYGLMNLFPDGAWDEGTVYWDFGMRYFTTAMSTIVNCTNTDYGMMNTPSMPITGYYPFRVFGSKSDFNFSDAAEGYRMGIEAQGSFFIADWFDDVNLNSLKYDYMMKYGIASVKEMLYFNPELYRQGAGIELDGYVRNVESGSFRKQWDSDDAPVLMFHTGDVTSGHGHVDSGTFAFDVDGLRWAIDLGPDDYNLEGYSHEVKRYEYYRTRAEGHNMVVLNPDASSGQNMNGKGIITEFVTKPCGGYAVADLTSAYDDAQEYKRGYMLTANRNAAIIQDEIVTTKPSELYWFMHTKANINLSSDKRSAILQLSDKKVCVEILSDEGYFEVMDAVPLKTSPVHEDQNPNEGIKKLSIHLNNVEKTTISVAMYSITNGNKYELSCTPISEWSVPDGEIILPAVNEIKVNGEAIADFNPNKYSYTVTFPFEHKCMPAVEAYSNTYNVEVENAKTVPGKARVFVSDKEDSTINSVYTIEFKRETVIGTLDKPHLNIIAVTASDEPQPENPKENSIDGNLDTRWSAEGLQWISYDLGGEKTVTEISIAFMKNDTRKTKFKLQSSLDGINWTDIFDTQSSGEFEGFETFSMAKTSARYIRIYGEGNTENNWNSVNEVIIYGN